MIDALNAYILAILLLIAHKGVFSGLLFAFVIFHLNHKKVKEITLRGKIFKMLIFPPILVLLAFIAAPVVSHLGFGKTITASNIDMSFFAFYSILSIGFAIFLLRQGVQIFDKTKQKLTVSSEQERNKKTDVRQIEQHVPKKVLDFDPLKFMDKTKGVFLGLDEHKKPTFIEFGGGTSAPHVQVIGTTGAGKGVSLGVMASQFLERGEAVFFCDPKNDEWATHVMYAAAKRTGKPYYYINLNRPNPEQFNLFEGATSDEAFEMFQAGFSLTEKGDASDFYGIADRREAGIVAKIMTEKNLTIAEAYEHQADLIEESGAEKFYGKLREMAETHSINAKSGGISLEKVIEEGGCVYIVGSMRNDLIKTAQRILLVRLIQLAEKRDRMSGKELRKICIVLDEVKYHLSRPALEGLGAARDKGVHLVLAHQSLGDLKDCSKDLNPDAVVDAVVENCRIKICYKVQSKDTAEWLAAMSGTILVDDESRNVEKNLALSETVDNKRTIRQAERYFIDENMILNLPPSVSVLYGSGLPKFVSIRPLKVAKDAQAIAINQAIGASIQTPAQSINIEKSEPFSQENEQDSDSADDIFGSV